METGGDWVALLPYALSRVRNSPYTLGFPRCEIMFGRPPPLIPSLQAELLAEFESQDLSFLLRGLQRAHEDLCAICEAANPAASSVQTGRLVLSKAPPGDLRAALEGSLRRGADYTHRSQGRRHRHLGPSHPRPPSRPLCSPGGPHHTMEPRLQSAQLAQATARPTRLALVTLLTLFAATHAAGSPHAPYNLTWQIVEPSSGAVLSQTSRSQPGDAWFPELRVDLLALIPVQYDPAFARSRHFYVCPGHARAPGGGAQDPCGGAESYFCASWSCVSTGHIWWTPPKTGDLIAVERPAAPPCGLEGPCNPPSVKILSNLIWERRGTSPF
ncbi:uncharacterized protein LOC123652741 isoform X3 [Pipistrellus kuhlii]|uniref:uncharacterized protein LOC123652741 isoform X3 n=1 Tax=Pipistrellus kuhlii TaxID=59472 RepID=UPI001E2732CD|nr:uncharacterized protein LOC123652741 isoform X3 [Pipistrellus kuhlii]